MSPRSSLESTRPVLYTAVGLSQSTTNRYGEKTMLRFAVRARSACSEKCLKKCVDRSVQKRELSASTAILNASSRRAAHEPRLRCLIDSGTRSNDTEGRSRRALSTTTTPTTTPRKTCLYDLHVENRGEPFFKIYSSHHHFNHHFNRHYHRSRG